MTNAPADLLLIRADLLDITGLAHNTIGIVGNQRHAEQGTGYHLGRSQLKMVRDPYSARLARDRNGLTESASAMDVDDDWPHGGRKAWLRFNNDLVAALKAGDPALASIRGVNYSPDGVSRKRIDRVAGFRVESSTDTVTIHTHLEFFRDTEGTRAGACRARLRQLAHQAIYGSDGGFLMALDDKTQGSIAWTLLHIPDPNGGTSRVPLHVWCAAQDKALDAIAAKVGLDAAELVLIRQAALEGAEAGVLASVDAFVAAVNTQLQGKVGLTEADVESAVRAVFASAGS
jgi:hypothetical protein